MCLTLFEMKSWKSKWRTWKRMCHKHILIEKFKYLCGRVRKGSQVRCFWKYSVRIDCYVTETVRTSCKCIIVMMLHLFNGWTYIRILSSEVLRRVWTRCIIFFWVQRLFFSYILEGSTNTVTNIYRKFVLNEIFFKNRLSVIWLIYLVVSRLTHFSIMSELYM